MKKLLGISIAAILAVSPMLANADPVSRTVVAPGQATTTNEGVKVATTSYVKGAYNAVEAAVAGIIADTAATTADHITGGATVGSNLKQLSDAVKSNDDKIGTIGNLTGNSTDFTQDEAHSTIVEAINTTKAEANATRAYVGDKTTLNAGFGNNATVTGALNKLYQDLGSTDNKVMVVYSDWNGGGDAQRTVNDKVSLVSASDAANATGTVTQQGGGQGGGEQG